MADPIDNDRTGMSLRTLAGVLRSMRAGQVVLTGLLVVIATIRAVADGAPVPSAVAASVLFLGWYAIGLATAARYRDARQGALWLVGLGILWAVGLMVSAEYVWVAFPLWLLAGYLLPLAWAAVFGATVLILAIAAPLMHHGATTYANVIGPLIGGLFAFGLARGYVELAADMRDRQRLVDSLLRAQDEMAELQEELARTQREAGVIAERTRLSRDIHDTVAQGLSSIGMLSRAARDEAVDHSADRALQQIGRIAHDSLTDVRRIIDALAPAELDETALAGALRRMVEHLAAETGIDAELRVDPDLGSLPMPVEVALLRTAQSALANVRMHSGARRVTLSLAQAGDTVRLDIVDDGRGFDAAFWDTARRGADGSGYGLHAMRERLRELGGGLDLESAQGEGAALSAHAPTGGFA